MSASNRPGGLTALAIINFVFGGLSVLGALALMVPLTMSERLEQAPPEQRAQLDALASIPAWLLVVTLAAAVVGAVLLVVSGIGYLKLKRFLGRTLGNTYAVFSIVTTIPLIWMPAEIGGGANLNMLLNLLYPVLTLFLLNVTFKEDLVN